MLIQVKNLRKIFKTVRKTNWLKDLFWPNYLQTVAVDNISFNIDRGEAVAILGPNGAGKTTTIKMLTGLIYPTGGTVVVNGFVPYERKKTFLKQIGLVLGNKGFANWDLTPMQNLNLIKDLYNISDKMFKNRLESFCRLLNLTNKLNVQTRKLSLGERMKFEIIASLIYKPSIVFLDEPTIGLDVLSKQKIRDFLYKINREEGTTIILTSHDMMDVEYLTDRVIIINKGIKVFDGKLQDLKDRYALYKEIKFVSNINIRKMQKTLPFKENIVKINGPVLVYKVKRDIVAKLIRAVIGVIQVNDIDIKEMSLDDIVSQIFQDQRK